MGKVGNALSKIPLVGNIAKAVVKKVRYNNSKFTGSKNYWETRYAKGGDSGFGSYNKFAQYKADYINAFVRENGISTIVEFGCGDGNQLTLAHYPDYLGLDVSSTIIETCQEKFQGDSTKKFQVYDTFNYDKSIVCELSMSLDVIYHLIEEDVYTKYMEHLFSAASKFVVVYSSNEYREQTFHEKHRKFTDWIDSNTKDWDLVKVTENIYKKPEGAKEDTEESSHADFYIFQKKA